MECEGSPQTLLSAVGLGAESTCRHTRRHIYIDKEKETTHTDIHAFNREMVEDKKERSDRDKTERGGRQRAYELGATH